MDGDDEEEDDEEDERRSAPTTSPVLSSNELTKLQQRVSSCAHWSLVPTAPLSGILTYLDAHVSEGLNVSSGRSTPRASARPPFRSL